MDRSQFDAVIFDMDGVLIDSEPLWKIAMEEAFQSVGCNITRKDFQKTVGLRIDEVVRFWYKERGWEGLTPEQLEDVIMQKMVALIQANGEPLPGVLETIDYLRQNGFKIGLGTSSYRVLIDAVLETLQLTTSFDFTHSAEDEIMGKPHPAVYLTVAARLNVAPQKCLVIEDSFNGVVAGLAAQMKVVCIPEKTHHPDERLAIATKNYPNMLEFLKDFSS
ncbi:MAG: hexitol phosphatase HxpB [Fluviicola sp. XM-24bin1]|nr:MAG: hexitol phosphatase HxpB [Fluviicola sp. XM-24bin1]